MPLKRKPKKPRKQRIVIQTVRSTDLTLDEYRRSPELVNAALKVWNDPNFLLIWDVLKNESPVNQGFPVIGVQATDRVAHQSKIEGYHLALNNLEALKTLDEQSIPLEATFENPDKEQNAN